MTQQCERLPFINFQASHTMPVFQGPRFLHLAFQQNPFNKVWITERSTALQTYLYLSCTFCLMSCSESWEMSRSRYPDNTSVAFSRSAWLF